MPRPPHFHLTFSRPTDVWPSGCWSLYQITGDEIARRYRLDANDEIIACYGWPGFIACFASLDEATARINELTAEHADAD